MIEMADQELGSRYHPWNACPAQMSPCHNDEDGERQLYRLFYGEIMDNADYQHGKLQKGF
jgi:hypothetical protein